MRSQVTLDASTDSAPMSVSQIKARLPKGISDEHARLLRLGLEQLPPLAPVAARLLQLTLSEHTDAQDLVEVIQTDQSLSGRLLKLVNSAASGLREPITSVPRATVLLGFAAVRSCALSAKCFDALKGWQSPSCFDQSSFWKHSIAVACASRTLAGHVRGLEPEEAFTAGLLHDVGRLALAYALPGQFEEIQQHAVRSALASHLKAERDVVGVTHARLGGLVAEQWGLPAVLKNATVLHHTPSHHWPEQLPGRNLARIVQLADRLCRGQHIGLTGRYPAEPSVQKLRSECGFTEKVFQRVVDALPSQVEGMANALDMGQFDQDALLRDGLARANEELGRMTDQLLVANMRLNQQREEVEADLRVAARVQQTIVPPSQTVGRVRVEVGYQPMIDIGGDYAHLNLREERPAVISLGDVTGHGIAAALVASRIHGEVGSISTGEHGPAEVLRRMNVFFCDTFAEQEALMSFVAAELDPEAGTLTWSSAAHPPILHRHAADSRIDMLPNQTTFLGIDPDLSADGLAETVPVAPGDLLYMYTDGLVEVADAEGDQLGVEGLCKLVTDTASLPPDQIPPAIFDSIATFRHGTPQDDMMLLVVTYQ